MDNIPDIFEKLRISLGAGENSRDEESLSPVQNLVDALINALKETKEIIPDSRIQELLPFVKKHLQGNDMVMTACLLQLIAEVSKSENLCQECIDTGIIPCVLNCLENENPHIILQALRALGNISHNNNKAQEEMLKSGGVEKIIKKIKDLHDFNDKPSNADQLPNVSLDNETLQMEVVNFGAIPLLLDYIKNNLSQSNLCLMATNAVSCLVDLDEGRLSFISSGGCQIFVNGLKNSSGELSMAIGDCLMDLSDKDDIKMALVEENCVDILQEIITVNNNTEGKELIKKLKVAVDLIILLLGDDHCLDLMFALENNTLIDKILLWNHSAQAYVRNSGPVAIGNIARTETNCVQLVKMEVHKHLSDLLCNTISTRNNQREEIQLQVAVLSALKNLAIPVNNKPVLIQSGVLDCALKFISSPETPSPLTFRAIAVTRLLVQGQATAVDAVCVQEQCISNLVTVAQSSGIEGLKWEASRLLATLLKNARTSDSILSVVKNNGLLPVVSMIKSSHSIMQNEALVGIALAVNVIGNELTGKIDESNLLSNINSILSVENPEPQTSYNSMAVIEALFVKGVVTKRKLEDSGILNSLEKLTNHSHQIVSQRASSFIDKVKNS